MSKISAAEICKMGIGFALGYLAYKFISNSDPNKSAPSQPLKNELSEQIKRQQQQNKEELAQLNELQELLAHKCANFQLETQPHNESILTKQCLLQFFASTYDILNQKQIVEINTESRKARRQIFQNIDEKYETYFRFVCTLDENIKYLLEKAQKDFAVVLNMDFRKVMDSISYHIDNEEDVEEAEEFRIQVVEVMSANRESLANYMPLFNSPIAKSRLIEILAFQSAILQNKKQQLVDLVKKMGLETKQQEEAVPLFLTCYLEDSIWQKYQVESQQMSVSSEDMDENLKQMFQRFKSLRTDVIKQMHTTIQADIIIPEAQK